MAGELQKILGRNLRKYREGLAISQEAFAEQIHFHRTYLGALERGERNLSLRSVEDLADKLGVEPLWLLRQDSSKLSAMKSRSRRDTK